MVETHFLAGTLAGLVPDLSSSIIEDYDDWELERDLGFSSILIMFY